MNKINKYIFIEIIKGCLLIFFIFLSIAWLLQFTRLISLTNMMQIDIITILYLSLFLIPNLITIIIPFVIIFGLIITFLKLYKDKEIISIYSLGLNLTSVKKPLLAFTLIIFSLIILFNFFISPKIYKQYKVKEFEIRNKINFDKILVSNFIKINENTFLDFENNEKNFEEVFIKFTEGNDNLIYAQNAEIIQKDDKFIFNLINGFKITTINEKKIEKLEFGNYKLEINDNNYEKFDNFDKNTLSIFDDIKNKNYINISYKLVDSIIIIIIVFLFYLNNIKNYNFYFSNILIYIFFASLILILNELIKNFELNILTYLLLNFISILLVIICINFVTKKNV
jgi:lipopolysaccharide export LptBFGC system permease protein LptF